MQKIAGDWLGPHRVEVLRTPEEITDPALRQYVLERTPEDQTPGGLYHNGKVLVFTHAHEDLPGIERTVAHEMIGHFGLRGLFHGNGDHFSRFLDQVHASIEPSDLYRQVDAAYRAAYKELSPEQYRRAVTEEYIAHLAEARVEPGVWKKIVAVARGIARQLGLVSRWTDDDLYHLLGRVASDVRNGRIGLGGREAAETMFGEYGKATSTYHGAAGRGEVTHYDDGSRDLAIEGLKATVQTSQLGDKTALSVGDLAYDTPADLLKLTRFAGEEGKQAVAIGKDQVSKADLDASGIPYTDRMGFYELPASKVSPGPMFALRNRASAGQEIDDLVAKTVDHSDLTMTPWDRMQRAARNIRDGIASGDSIMHLKAGYVDAGAPFERTERAMNGGLLLDAAESPYKMFWMSKNNEQITAGILKVGIPEYQNGSFLPVTGRQGLVDIFSPLYRTPDGKAIDHLWEAYAYAKRANELIKQINPDGSAREQLLTQPEIDKLVALEQKYPVFKDILDKYQTFNKQLLDLAVDRGAMSQETADLWKQNTYVPFYRHADETENNHWQFATRGISGKKVSSQRLWGSAKRVDPIIDNIVRNTGSVLDKIYSNEAMRRCVALGQQSGVMERVKNPIDNVNVSLGDIEKTLAKMGFYVGQKRGPGKYSQQVSQADLDRVASFVKMSKPMGKDIVTVYQQGKPVYYRVNDVAWYKALTAFDQIGTFDKVFNTLFGGPKKLLTMATIYNPGFMFRTFIRDAITAWMQTGTNRNMMKHALANAKDVYTDSAFQNGLRAAGFNGNAYFNAHEMREHMEELHGKNGWTLLSTPKKLWHAYHKIGMMAEQINRLSVAKHILERGGSMAEAAWQGQNTLNFKMRGSNKAMQLLIRTVPFLNARIQGLNRLYLGMTGRDVTENRSRAVASYVTKALSVATASLALQLHNEDDPRYNRIPEEDKDLYYHLFIGNQHFTMPKPFETGAMFSTIPERALRALQGKDTARTWVEAMQRTFLHTLDMDPTPQLAEPLLEDYANKDALSGRPIVPQQYQKLLPAQQASPYSSPFLEHVAGSLPAAAPDTLRSPLRLQHLYRGYTSSVGMWLLQGADAMTRAVDGSPKQPASRYSNSFLETVLSPLGASPADNDPRNKYVQQLYDAQDQADDAYGSLMKVAKEGDYQEARRIAGDNGTALHYRAVLHSLTAEMGELRKAETAVMQSRVMSPEDKRTKLDTINATRVKLLDKVGPILDVASDYH